MRLRRDNVMFISIKDRRGGGFRVKRGVTFSEENNIYKNIIKTLDDMLWVEVRNRNALGKSNQRPGETHFSKFKFLILRFK